MAGNLYTAYQKFYSTLIATGMSIKDVASIEKMKK
jgi:hypothetical protein